MIHSTENFVNYLKCIQMLTTESMVVRLVCLAVLCWTLHVRNIQSLESSMRQLLPCDVFPPLLDLDITSNYTEHVGHQIQEYMQDLVDPLHSLASAHL